MIRIAISQAAFDAIARTLPLGSVGYEAEANERGERYVSLEEVWVNRLGAMRRPGESYSNGSFSAGGSMKYPITQFKSLEVALRELEPFVRNGQHLLTGRRFRKFGGMLSREAWANWSRVEFPVWAETGPTWFVSGRTGVRAKATIPLPARNRRAKRRKPLAAIEGRRCRSRAQRRKS